MTVQSRRKKIFLMRKLFSQIVLSEGPVTQSWSTKTKLQELLIEVFFFFPKFSTSNFIRLPLQRSMLTLLVRESLSYLLVATELKILL